MGEVYIKTRKDIHGLKPATTTIITSTTTSTTKKMFNF